MCNVNQLKWSNVECKYSLSINNITHSSQFQLLLSSLTKVTLKSISMQRWHMLFIILCDKSRAVLLQANMTDLSTEKTHKLYANKK